MLESVTSTPFKLLEQRCPDIIGAALSDLSGSRFARDRFVRVSVRRPGNGANEMTSVRKNRISRKVKGYALRTVCLST